MAMKSATKSAAKFRKNTLGFRLIYTTTFTIFLIVGILDRLVPLRWITGATGSADSYLGVLAEAQAAARTYTPFAFMG